MGGLWDRLLGRIRRDAIRREAEEENMSPAERRLASESIEDLQADRFVQEHLGGFDPERREK
ncbi:MAG TPA: hypothetical protein VFA66_00935 [Gaiellaceae bacterium]|nr:hypothetical protein [Gaiellaceae bacterium]